MELNGTGQFAFFGDSLTDDGNLFRVSEGLILDIVRLSLSGFDGRVSDGPTYAEHVAPLLGLSPSLNYAVAAAEADGTQTLLDLATERGALSALLVPPDDPALQFDINLGAQIDRFAADTAGEGLSQVTAFVMIGANDYGGIDATDPASAIVDLGRNMLQAVGATLEGAAELAGLGVGRVVVSGLPSAGFLPVFAGLDATERAALEEVVGQHNGLLQSGVALMQAGGSSAAFFDLTEITEAFVDDPTQFGVLAPWDLTLRSGNAQLAAYENFQVGFWDDLHPSAATHGVIGGWVAFADRGEALTAGDDSVRTGRSPDLVLAYGGDDLVRAGAGDDLVFLGSGADESALGAGRDLASGGAGRDTVRGGGGADVIAGGQGNDTVSGNRGADVLIDGAGDDVLRGQKQDDTFIFFQGALLGGADTGLNRMLGGAGQDRLILALTGEGAAAFEAAETRKAGLAALGIETRGIELVEVVTGHDGLADTLGGGAWYDAANLWGLV